MIEMFHPIKSFTIPFSPYELGPDVNKGASFQAFTPW